MHFNIVHFTVYMILSTIPMYSANSGLLVLRSKSQFAENFLNTSEVKSGPLSEKTSLGISCHANIFSYVISLLVRGYRGFCWSQSIWSNNPQQSSLDLEQVRTNFCPKFVKDLMVCDGFVLLTCIAVWHCICYVCIHVWPVEYLVCFLLNSHVVLVQNFAQF